MLPLNFGFFNWSTNLSNGNYYLFDMGSNGYRIQIYNGTLYFGDGSNTTSGSGITKCMASCCWN